MDGRFLGQQLQFFSSSGKLVSPEQLAQLSNSMTLAKHNNHFTKIIFWGKIEGVKDDYWICQGINGTDELCDRTTLYSFNGNDWHLLNTPDEKTQSDALHIRGRFLGDPMHEYDQQEVRSFGAGEQNDEDLRIHVKEEDRLAAVIMKIDEEAMVVPRGAFLRSPAGIVTPNDSFGGLEYSKSNNLENWLHFAPPVMLPKQSLLEKADICAPIDFLHSAAEDTPSIGSWSIQSERGPGVDAPLVKLRSLHWPGAEACHVPDTKQFSRVYFGNGVKNINLPFMLPAKQA